MKTKPNLKSKILIAFAAILCCVISFSSFAQTPCDPPSGLSSSGITTSAAIFSWTPVSGAVQYNVVYQEVGSTSAITVSSATESVTVNSLNVSSDYEWQVQTDCGNSNLSAFSASETFSTPSLVCSVPAGLNTTGITSTDATMNWTIVSGAVGYNIQYRIVGAPSWTSSSSWTLSSATTASLTVSSLASGNYEWQVQTDCGNSNLSTFTASDFYTTLSPVIIPCNTPAGLSAANITFTSAELKWIAEPGSLFYFIQYREVGGPSWNTIGSTIPSVTISSLTASTPYEWQVQNVCEKITNLSNYSTPVTFTTSGPPVCNQIPSGLNAANVTEGSATLSWTSSSNEASFAGYNVQYREVGNTSWTSVTSTSATVNISSLTPSANYEWQVQGNCGTSLSAFSSMSSFTMLSHAPPVNTSTQYISVVPNPADPATRNVIFVSSGSAATDAQIVHDWLLAHGLIDR